MKDTELKLKIENDNRDTPRTNVACGSGNFVHCVDSDFARSLERELAAHNPGSSAAGYVFNQMREAFVALGSSRHAFRPHVLVELASAVKADRDAFAIILRQISGFVDANGDKTPEARMATNALVEAARFMCPNDPSPEHKINAAGDQW